MAGWQNPSEGPTLTGAAYGFNLAGVAASEFLLSPAVGGRPTIMVTQARGDPPSGPDHLDERHASVRLPAAHLQIDRDAGRAEITSAEPLALAELMHPLLAPICAVFAHWRQQPAMHAGGFVHQGGAWSLVGASEAGKSTLLAWLAHNGHDILTDDLLVAEPGGAAFAGPRCIDLRADAAARLYPDHPRADVRGRTRTRVRLGPTAASVPLRGFVFLKWGPRLALERVAVGERPRRLAQAQTIPSRPIGPLALLDLAVLPMFELSRPRDWSSLGTAEELLVNGLGD